jgi:hypothetical protein
MTRVEDLVVRNRLVRHTTLILLAAATAACWMAIT